MERSITIYGLRQLDLIHDALVTLFDDVNKQWEQSQYKDQDLDKYLDDINSLLERVRQANGILPKLFGSARRVRP